MRKHLLPWLLAWAIGAAAATPDSANLFVRQPRVAAISGEIGMNSLSSLIGVDGTFFIRPRFPIDLGLGLSGVGLRPGVRARYEFSITKLSTFVYGGFKYGLGRGDKILTHADPETDSALTFQIKPSPFLDLGIGVDYLADHGFYWIGSLGWSFLLRSKNYVWLSGDPSDQAETAANIAYGSGPALALSLGYAFK